MYDKLPNRIDILGQKYRIIVDKKKLSDGSNFGECHFDNKSIIINEEQSTEEQWRTLGHELLHALCHRNGLRFSGALTEELEEILAESVGNLLADVLFNSAIKYYKPRKKKPVNSLKS